MACEALPMFERFITFVALEWSVPRMRSNVLLQMIRTSACVVALVTFERLLSCVHRHHVSFQFASLNARIIARGASVWLFTRVRLLVPLQVVCICCFVFTLIALVQIFPGVLLDMPFEVGRLAA